MTRTFCQNSMISNQEHYWSNSESDFIMPFLLVRGHVRALS